MKRQDVVIGVEYAATAALAYGREPRTRASRVRFTDTRPGPWLRVLTSAYKAGASVVDGKPAWTSIKTELVKSGTADANQAARLPESFRGAIVAKYGAFPGKPKISDEVTYVDAGIKGGLPGEYERGGEWFPTLVVPAEIHRTWADVEGAKAVRAKIDADLDAEAKIPEIRAALAAVGLDSLIHVNRSGKGVAIQLTPPAGSARGEFWYAEFVKWANDRRPGGWGDVVSPEATR